MSFCINCGEKIPDNACFCPKCGQKVIDYQNNTESTTYSEVRREEFVGTLKKCPACGAEITSMTAFCPVCGHELTDAVIPKDIQKLNEELYKIGSDIPKEPRGWKSWGFIKKMGWIFLWIFLLPVAVYVYFYNKRNKAEDKIIAQKKALHIGATTFSNDRATILEALLYIKAQMHELVTNKFNASTMILVNAWTMKASTIYQKASLLLHDDPIAINAYNDIEQMKKVAKRKQVLHVIKIVVLIILIIILSYFWIQTLAESGTSEIV